MTCMKCIDRHRQTALNAKMMATAVAGGPLKKDASQIPWVEKYRPAKIDDIAHQEEVKCLLRQVIENGSMPNLLLHGPPGTGKTSAVHALSRELFGDEWRSRVLELNASDDRGIAVVRDRIKLWTRTYVAPLAAPPPSTVNSRSRQTPPTWKIVILDEADMMTVDAQSALRRMMEDSASNTRFAIICNYVSKIIDPIASRCAKFRFEPVAPAAQRDRLRQVATSEHVTLQPDGLEKIMEIAEGDLRVGITLMQTSAKVFGEEVNAEHISSVAGVPPEQVCVDLMTACGSSEPNEVIEAVANVISAGWDVGQVFKQMNRTIVESPDIADIKKAAVAVTLAQVGHGLLTGGDEHLLLLQLCLDIQNTQRSSNLPKTTS